MTDGEDDSDPIPATVNASAASILMTVMYAARMARIDLLRAVGNLARKLTKWGPVEDKKLRRLMEYINGSQNERLTGFIGDQKKDLVLRLFTDADFAGDRSDAKSTSGIFLALVGPHSFFPLAAQSKKQTSVSHSSAESEIVAANCAVREIGLPAKDLWEVLLKRKDVPLELYEDNQSTSQMMELGKFPTLRHVQRTHGINTTWLSDCLKRTFFCVKGCHTDRQAADIFTKYFINGDKWNYALEMLGFISEEKSLSHKHPAQFATVIAPLRIASAVREKVDENTCEEFNNTLHFSLSIPGN